MFYSLCEILSLVYNRIHQANETGLDANPGYRDAFAKIDGKLKKIVSQVTKEIYNLSTSIIKQEVAIMDPLFDLVTHQDEPDPGNISD